MTPTPDATHFAEDYWQCEVKNCTNNYVICTLSRDGYPMNWYCKEHAGLAKKDEDQS